MRVGTVRPRLRPFAITVPLPFTSDQSRFARRPVTSFLGPTWLHTREKFLMGVTAKHLTPPIFKEICIGGFRIVVFDVTFFPLIFKFIF